MKRHPDWYSRLAAYLARHARMPYAPGTFDCIIFAEGALAAMTGRNRIAAFVGTYDSVPAGLRIVRRLGFRDHIAAVTDGLQSIPVCRAQIGDLAEADGIDGLPAMGVVGGERIHVVGWAGLETIPLLSARRAWRT